jgi:hypothetical protein
MVGDEVLIEIRIWLLFTKGWIYNDIENEESEKKSNVD